MSFKQGGEYMQNHLITFGYAAILGFFYVFLAYRVIFLRRSRRVSFGGGGHGDLQEAIRIHGNFGEYVPLALILLLGLELSQFPVWLVHVSGCVLVVARLLHFKGLTWGKGVTPGRFLGTFLTLTLILIEAALILIKYCF